MDCSLPGSSVHGILQARILVQVAISFSKGSSEPKDWTWVSYINRRSLYYWVTREVQLPFVGLYIAFTFPKRKIFIFNLGKFLYLFLINLFNWRSSYISWSFSFPFFSPFHLPVNSSSSPSEVLLISHFISYISSIAKCRRENTSSSDTTRFWILIWFLQGFLLQLYIPLKRVNNSLSKISS